MEQKERNKSFNLSFPLIPKSHFFIIIKLKKNFRSRFFNHSQVTFMGLPLLFAILLLSLAKGNKKIC
jgi:hypothetical protein